MDTNIVKLHFSSPVHFGEGRLSDGAATCEASTLFSALFQEAVKLSCETELLKSAASNNLLLSDLFPFIEDSYYLPKPIGMNAEGVPAINSGQPKKDMRFIKAIKKLSYIKAQNFESYFGENFDPIAEFDAFRLGESFLNTRVNLGDGRDNGAGPYAVGGFSFYANAGLYFISQGSYDIRPLLEQLQYSGLGGKRSVGYGRFTYEVAAIDEIAPINRYLNVPEGSSFNKWLLLSSAIPKKAELTDEFLKNGAYLVKRRGGFVQSSTHASSPQKKRDIFVFTPGSIFSQQFEGDIVDVNLTEGFHPVYSYARAMWMVVK